MFFRRMRCKNVLESTDNAYRNNFLKKMFFIKRCKNVLRAVMYQGYANQKKKWNAFFGAKNFVCIHERVLLMKRLYMMTLLFRITID